MPASGIWPTKWRRTILPRLRTRVPCLSWGVGAITCHTRLNFAEFLRRPARRGVAPRRRRKSPDHSPAWACPCGKTRARQGDEPAIPVRMRPCPPHMMRTRGEEPDIMTYVVTEACIKCKLMDCVEVCPVDCFYEGENMLVIHPDECIDCGVC